MKGRPADPTRARRRTGHRPKPGEAKAIKAVPTLPLASSLLEPPADLPEQMLETWARVVEMAGGVSTLKPGDALVIEALVRRYHRMRDAGALIDGDDGYGLMVRKVSGDIAASPFVAVERDAARDVLRIAEHYGLTVAARMRLGLLHLAGRTLAQALNADLEEG